ncbi:unnamed protein product, partial [Allacma fusca]
SIKDARGHPMEKEPESQFRVPKDISETCTSSHSSLVSLQNESIAGQSVPSSVVDSEIGVQKINERRKKPVQLTTLTFAKLYVSDGSRAQYKNYKLLANLIHHDTEFGVQAVWVYTATSHGKSVCDGISAVIGRCNIENPKQFSVMESRIQLKETF